MIKRFLIIVVVLVTIYPFVLYSWNKEEILSKSKPYDKVIEKYAKRYELDENLIRAVITVESAWNDSAYNTRTNCVGLMQIQARAGTEKYLFNPDNNIRVGCSMLRNYINLFDGNIMQGLSAYNYGPTGFRRYYKKHKKPVGYAYKVKKIYSMLIL